MKKRHTRNGSKSKKESKKKESKKKKGTSSVFLVMILASMITLVMAFVSAALRVGAIGYVDGLVNLSSRSLLSEYDLHLKNDYGLFAFRGHKQEIINKLTENLAYTLDHNKYIKLTGVDANTGGYSLADVDIFEKELNEYTKFAIARGMIGDLLGEEETQQQKPIDTENKGRTLRNHKIIDQLPSGGNPGDGSIVDTLKEMINGGGLLQKGSADYLTVQYIMHTFKNAQKTNSRDTFFNNEAEYILEGEMSDEKNRKKVRSDIIKVRNAVNLVFVWTNAKMRTELLAAAQLVGVEVGTALAAIALSEAWALAEAENDMRILEHGKKVPLYKTEDTWAIDIQSIIDNKESGYIDTHSATGSTYQEYLQMFLFAQPRAMKLGRIMDLIQINIQGKYDRTFLIKEHNMGFWVKAEADGRDYIYDQKY